MNRVWIAVRELEFDGLNQQPFRRFPLAKTRDLSLLNRMSATPPFFGR